MTVLFGDFHTYAQAVNGAQALTRWQLHLPWIPIND